MRRVRPSPSFEIDVNLGASHDFGAKATVAAGLAFQYEAFERATGFGEVFHDQKWTGAYQVAARYAFRVGTLPGRCELSQSAR